MTALAPEVLALAQRQAAGDRALLARLRARGRVQRNDGRYERNHPEVAQPFVADIERRAAGLRNGMDTIRPNKKSRKSKRR